MKTSPKRPTSNALRNLRGGATLSCWVFGLALGLQALTWAFVNYTELRQANIEDLMAQTRRPVVVDAQARSNRPNDTRTAASPEETGNEAATGATDPAAETESPATATNTKSTSGIRPSPAHVPAAETPVGAPADPNQAVTRFDIYFRTMHQLARAAGMMALLILLVQLSLAVVVAAQTRSTGIAQIVAGHSWMLILGSLTIPWQSIVPEFPFDGLFSEYSTMVADSELVLAHQADAPALAIFYGSYLLLPAMGVVGITLVGFKFRAGVEGLIISGPSPFEIQLEEEASNREAGTLVGGGGRNAAALRTTMKSDGLRIEKPKSLPHEVASVTQPAVAPPLRRPI